MGKYDHLLHLDRPEDPKHPPMPMHNRAAQFAPFDALTGLGERLSEASRITQMRPELSEEARQHLNDRLRALSASLQPPSRASVPVTVTYFETDARKDGGAVLTLTGTVLKLSQDRELLLVRSDETDSDTAIAFDDILQLDSSLFSDTDIDPA